MATSDLPMHGTPSNTIDPTGHTYALTSLASADAAVPAALRRAPALGGVTGAVPCSDKTKIVKYENIVTHSNLHLS